MSLPRFACTQLFFMLLQVVQVIPDLSSKRTTRTSAPEHENGSQFCSGAARDEFRKEYHLPSASSAVEEKRNTFFVKQSPAGKAVLQTFPMPRTASTARAWRTTRSSCTSSSSRLLCLFSLSLPCTPAVCLMACFADGERGSSSAGPSSSRRLFGQLAKPFD